MAVGLNDLNREARYLGVAGWIGVVSLLGLAKRAETGDTGLRAASTESVNTPAHRSDGAQARQTIVRTVGVRPVCPSCRVTIDTGATLTLPLDSLSFGPATRLTAIGGGRIAAAPLVETPIPAIFDRSGRFIRLIARAGRGPGEVPFAEAVVSAPGDSVWVVDGAVQGRHVFDDELRFVRIDQVLAASTQIVFGPNRQVVAASWTAAPSAAGFPLHLMENYGIAASSNKIRLSFGADNPEIDARKLAEVGDDPETNGMRYLTPGDGNTFWAYNPTRFLLEQFDFSGRLLVRAEHAVDGWYADAITRKPGMGAGRSLPLNIVQRSATPGLLWLIYHDRRSDWASRDPRNRTLPNYALYNDLVIEAVETPGMTLLAQLRLPGTWAFKVDNASDLLAVVRPVSDIFAQLQLLKLNLYRSR